MKTSIIIAKNNNATPDMGHNKLSFMYKKYKSFSILIGLVIVLSSCSKEDEFKIIAPSSIAFVHEDGSALSEGECINPNTNYAVLVKTSSEGSGIFEATTIEYTLNGVPFIMSFMSDGEQLNPIKLIDGQNKAQIVGTPYKAYLSFNTHDNFELVE
jgi:hypothetical protein